MFNKAINIRKKILNDKLKLIVGVTGSRRRNNRKDRLIVYTLLQIIKPDIIISGDCKDCADEYAKDYAEKFNIKFKENKPCISKSSDYYENVNEYYKRNEKIAIEINILIALVSKDRTGGTENTIKHFLNRNIEENIIIA